RRDLETASLLTQRMAHLPSQALARFLAATILCHLGRDVAPIARLVQIPPRPGETTAVLDGLRDLLAARQRAEATVAARPVGGRDRQVDKVLLQARAGLDAFHAVGPQVGRVPLLLILANGYVLAGRPEPALVAVEQALRLIERMDMRLHEPEAHRLLGEILLLHGEPASAAEDCFERAIDIARRLGLRWWELRATVSLARLWAGQGRAQAARTKLAEVYSWFTEGFDAPDMVEARALLDRLLMEPRPPMAVP
ncbi:MAG: hypothetical protein JXM73_01485, partial [Anaerolineae bacterium]|nr:hypothetical protein [Anaerolineae bacterium]